MWLSKNRSVRRVSERKQLRASGAKKPVSKAKEVKRVKTRTQKVLQKKPKTNKKFALFVSARNKHKTAKAEEQKKHVIKKEKKHSEKKKGFSFFRRPKKEAKTPVAAPEIKTAEKLPIAEKKPVAESTRKALHNIYFSKSEEGPKSDKKMQVLEERLEKRVGNVESSMSVVKEIIDSLRTENEQLRKEKQEMLDRLKDIEYIKSFTDETPPEEEEKQSMQTESRGARSAETSLDALLDLVIKKGAIKVPAAAKILGAKESSVEEWAKVLEEHDLIEVHYPTIGKPTLKKKGK